MGSNFITTNNHTKLYIISDTHLIADELHDNGSAFQRMRDTAAGKDLDYQEIALTAFTRKLLKEKPTALIITGDLTFNGELVSAQKLSSIFEPLQKAGILLFVVPGNHDIFDGWARKFEDDKELYATQISPFEWKNIFADSYENAVNVDEGSLSYSINLNQNYHLIFLDSNLYEIRESVSAPLTNGELSSRQLIWLEKDLKEAKSNKQYSLIFMHHNLYDHNEIIHGGYTLDNATELQKLCAKYHVLAVFSGHIHAQSIIHGNQGCSTPDIASSCFCMTDQGYGIIDLSANLLSYQRHSFDMYPYLTDQEKKLLPTKDFHQYLANIFNLTNRNQMSWLYKIITDKNEQQEVVDFIDKINWDFFIGKSNYSDTEIKQLQAEPAYQLITQKLPEMKTYLDTLLSVKQTSWDLNINPLHFD